MPHDRAHWEGLWAKTLREHPDKVAQRPPNAHLLAEVAGLQPGRALDAGCGHGAETLWLAAHGWEVTAVDFSANALAHARSTAEALGPDLAARIDWVEGDLAGWTPPRDRFDLVVCLYVHVAGSVDELVRRLASGVAPGGTLLLVGHRPIDPATGAPTAAAGQVQVSVESAVAALDPSEWALVVAEERPRPVAGTGVDAVIRARRAPFEISDSPTLDALERVFSSGARRCFPMDRVMNRIVLPPMQIAVRDGEPWVVIEQLGALRYAAPVPLAALAVAIRYGAGRDDVRDLTTAVTRRAAEALGFGPMFESYALELSRVSEIVEEADQETERLVLEILLAVRRARPVDAVDAPDPDDQVADALGRQAAAAGRTVDALVDDLDERLATWTLDPDGAVRRIHRICDDDRVRTDLAIDRGPGGATDLRGAVADAIASAIGGDLDLEQPPAPLATLLPVPGPVAYAVLGRVRSARPLVSPPALARYAALTSDRRLDEVRWLLGRAASALDPGSVVARWLAELDSALLTEDGLRRTFVALPFEDVVDAGLASLVFAVGELVCRVRGWRSVNAMWIQDLVELDAVAPFVLAAPER